MSLWRWIESCVHWTTDCWVSFDYSTTDVSLCKVCSIHVWGLFIITWSRFHHSPFSNSVQYLCFSHKSSCNMVISNPCMFKWLLPTNYLTLSTKVCLCLNGRVNLKWQRTPVLLPGKSHGQRSLVGSMGSQESEITEWLHSLHFHTLPILQSDSYSLFKVKIQCLLICSQHDSKPFYHFILKFQGVYLCIFCATISLEIVFSDTCVF